MAYMKDFFYDPMTHGAMFRVQGVSPPPLLIYRIGIAILLILLLHSYTNHRSQLEVVIKKARNDLEKCHTNSESIFSKLKVIFEHKKKMEQQYELQKNESEKKVSEMRKSIVSCQSELDKARQRTTTPLAEKVRISAEERLELQRGEMERLQKKVQEQAKELEQSQKALETVRKQVEDCQKTIKQHVGALPVAHYTQNETASFDRKHRAGEVLSFDRGAIEQHQGQLIPGAVLMERLEEKRRQRVEETAIHPDDRKGADDYVNEQPDDGENDYKEHH